MVEVGHRQLDVQLPRQAGQGQEQRHGVLPGGDGDEDALARAEDMTAPDETQDATLQPPGEGGGGPARAGGGWLIYWRHNGIGAAMRGRRPVIVSLFPHLSG